jgi:hypothetical protein
MTWYSLRRELGDVLCGVTSALLAIQEQSRITARLTRLLVGSSAALLLLLLLRKIGQPNRNLLIANPPAAAAENREGENGNAGSGRGPK